VADGPHVRPWGRGHRRRARRGTGRLVRLFDKGLIGFDVETGSRIVRPELLRLPKRGTNTTANQQYALAA